MLQYLHQPSGTPIAHVERVSNLQGFVMLTTEHCDGLHLTVPTHGPATATRVVEIVRGDVRLNGYAFIQEDFFKVNKWIRQVSPLTTETSP